MSTEKSGDVVLLAEEHFQEKNPYGYPVVGWLPTCQGIGSLQNPRGYAMLRVVLRKLVDGVMRAIYDQPLIVENPGSIIIAQFEDKIGLIESQRMVGERIFPQAGADYISLLEKNQSWEKLVASLGRKTLEAPRGLIPPGEEQDSAGGETLEAFIVKTAKLEALQEAGFQLTNVRLMGKVNMNTTFFAHAQYVVYARIEAMVESTPEDLEIIMGRKLYSLEELRELNEKGDFDDGLTLSALALCGLSLPVKK